MAKKFHITGMGMALPKRIVDNHELAKTLDTTDEWIVSHTGIRSRHICGSDETTGTLAAQAARIALENAGVKAEELGTIIVATSTPDFCGFPSTACLVQRDIGAVNASAMDIRAACTGFIYGMDTARALMHLDPRPALVVAGDAMSRIVDWTDRNTCVLFGDGAGAAILRHREGSRGILASRMGSNGNLADILYIPGGGSACPVTTENAAEKPATIRMNGRETYKHAVTAMVNASTQVLNAAGVAASDIACFIPHQANLRIIEAIASRLNVAMERFHINLDSYGNTSAAAVAIALDEAARSGRFQRGDKIHLVVFGGGLTWASTVIEW